jgi:lipoyl(octanoyl) transferase
MVTSCFFLRKKPLDGCAFGYIYSDSAVVADGEASLQLELAMIEYIYLGRVGYGEALLLQEEFVALRKQGRCGNVLLLLEHPPVLTLGRNAKRGNVLASDEMLAARGVTLHEINRGGDVTYHGPGQLVGYPIFDLRSLRNPGGGRLGPVDFVRLMEEAMIGLCAEFGVVAGRICGLTGVWCGLSDGPLGESCDRKASDPPQGERKIGAIGIHVSRGVTSHGFAFNVTTGLDDFGLIHPCGITNRPVTSLDREVKEPEKLPGLEAMAHLAARQFGVVLQQEMRGGASLAALRAQVEAEARQVFPAEDTPIQVPAEVERLIHSKDRPVRS